MRFIFLGIGGSMPTPRRQTAGLYLPDYGILFDGGSGVFPLRHLHGSEPLHVLMSHYHLDHSVGLFFLTAGVFQGRPEGTPQVHVYGPPGGTQIQHLGGETSLVWPIPLPFEFHDAPEQFSVNGVEVHTRRIPHSTTVLAYRLRFPTGETLAYVTDTLAPGDYTDFIRGVDILVHECTFHAADRQWAEVTHHSEAAGVAEVAAAAEVGELYLMHVGPLTDEARLLEEVRQRFPRTQLAVEGMVFPGSTGVDPKQAVFPGSFDPITVSHLDIIQSCRQMFKSLHMVVARNPAKDHTALFTPEERVELIRQCVPADVQVSSWGGLTVDAARRNRAGCIVRGLGRAEDYTLEVRLWKMNALMAPDIQTVWVPPRSENLDVSSSMIKEAAMFGGWQSVQHLVPEPIREQVGQRIAERRREVPEP